MNCRQTSALLVLLFVGLLQVSVGLVVDRSLARSGFHRDLVTVVTQIDPAFVGCTLVLSETIPDDFFLDMDDLKHKERMGGMAISSTISFDVERLPLRNTELYAFVNVSQSTRYGI